MVNMSQSRSYLRSTILLILISTNGCHEIFKSDHDGSICSLLESKHIATYPWTDYPLVYEPIIKGRLTVWAGVTTAPTSEFRCLQNLSSPNQIHLRMTNFADKYDWTYYDVTRGSTFSGVSVNHRENVIANITIENKQAMSYKECPEISRIDLDPMDKRKARLITICNDCDQNEINLIEGQLWELVKMRFNDQLKDSFYWHLVQLVSTQHYSGYLSLDDDFN